jgi:hypothetical protein
MLIPVQGLLPTLFMILNFIIYSELEQAMQHKASRQKEKNKNKINK